MNANKYFLNCHFLEIKYGWRAKLVCIDNIICVIGEPKLG